MKADLKRSATDKGGWPQDFDQTTLDYYADLCPEGAGQVHARTGLCLGLCVLWLHTLNNQKAFTAGEASSPLGRAIVTSLVNRTQREPAKWKELLKSEAATMSLKESFEEARYNDTNIDTLVTPEYMYLAIIVVHTGAGSHAVAARVTADWCAFFDPNEGEVIFSGNGCVGKLKTWFGEYLAAVLRRDYQGGSYIVFGYQ